MSIEVALTIVKLPAWARTAVGGNATATANARITSFVFIITSYPRPAWAEIGSFSP